MERIAIVGVGLIGASFALALRKAGFHGEILGVSSPRSIEAGMKIGALSRGVSLEYAAASADLLYLSQPIEQILPTLALLGPISQPDCLITDAGSTKQTIVETAARHLKQSAFLGGHPMAGKELRGAQAADADLFQGRPYILTPSGPNPVQNSPHIALFRQWLRRIGARIYEMDPLQHDRTVAFTSHLPQLLSTALASTLSRQHSLPVSQVFGPGLIDMTRLALSAPEVWMSVLQTNREAISQALAIFQSTLADLQQDLVNGSVESAFSTAAQFSRALRDQGSSPGTRT